MTKENVFGVNNSVDTGNDPVDASAVVSSAISSTPAQTVALDKVQKRLDDKDDYIRQLISENRELRLQKEAINQLATVETSKTPVVEPAISVSRNDAPVSKDELATLVKAVITQESSAKVAETNIAAVSNTLTQIYGSLDKAASALNARATMLDISVEDLQKIAAKSPKAFYAQLGINLGADGHPLADTANAAPRPTASNISATSLSSNVDSEGTPEVNTYAWFIKQYGVKGLNNEQVQVAMHKAALAKGDSFFNN